MRTLLFALALTLSANTMALDIDRITGGMFYVSSYSNATLFYNIDAGQSINITRFGGPILFCGVAALDNPGRILTSNYLGTGGTMRFSAFSKNLYIVLCIKASGLSDDSLLVIEDVVKRSSEQNIINDNDSGLYQQLQDAMDEVFE